MSEYQELWSMLSNNKFDLSNEVIESLKCSICNKLLIDAYVGECTCKYCWKCINNYLNGEGKRCPGQNRCRFKRANITVNIMKDNETNLTISKLKVNCPLMGCRYNSDLLQMINHMKICKAKLLLCPFSEMGCPAVLMKESELSAHLLEQMSSHNQAMNIWAMNIKNEILVNSMAKRDEIVNLCSKKLQNAVDARISQALLSKSGIRGKSFEEYEYALKDLKKQQEQLSNLFVEVTEHSNKVIDELKHKNSIQAETIAKLRTDNEVLIREIETIHNDKRKPTNSVQENQTQNQFINAVWIGESDTKPRRHFASLIWKIINFTQLRDENCSFFSDFFPSFCSNYAMRLNVFMGGCQKHNQAYICITVACHLNITIMTSVTMPRVSISMKIKHQLNHNSIVSDSKAMSKTSTNSQMSFHFKYADLERKCVIENGEILIECVLDALR